ncbi:hypothetical protein GCM10010392_22880 [Streptomyces clavifer]|uniref:Uncharacterized protein YukE n=1 Tax=Streptomyces clavifer TaxID=68188 RepID=A0ABS4VB70_9ACTN|nr:uncharacterized protein YukE [Streptomyces clavifer]GHA95576.1 hypothetical protein GCM10010392_22880 [Streptomyces clavifer]
MSTTSFDGMSHKQMIAWLDQANSTAVQAVADRLAHAGTEIDKIAGELKIRPQWVTWEGEGAFSFRTWSADLANATLRLAEYSKGASKQLSNAADAIALAKAATPRPVGDPEANLEAALEARNDPDSAALVRKLTEEREAVAAEMRKLSQTYNHSVAGFGKLDKPEFPPPPQAIAPEATGGRDNTNSHFSGQGAADGGARAGSGSASAPTGGFAPAGGVTTPAGSADGTSSVVSVVQRPVGMEIAGVDTLPATTTIPPLAPPGPSGSGKPEVGLPTAPMVLPPGIGGGPALPSTNAVGRTGNPRPPMTAGNGHLGTNPMGRPTRDGGIVGGRPVAQSPGRPTGGLPRGTVIGGDGTHAGRGAMGHGGGMGGAGGGSQGGITGGRRLAGETGGSVGGRPQQPGRTTGRPFTPGGTGLVRGTTTGDGSRGVGQSGRGGAAAPQRARDPRRDEGERPDYLVEDEETWQQGSRRVVPPVID